jgi:hypothetical protein
MTVPYRYRLMMTALLSAAVYAAGGPEGYYTAPRSTSAGIVFADQLSNGLFLLNGQGVETLSRMPGSGQYYSVSPDGRSVGYKEVRADGLQSLRMIDLETGSAVQLQALSFRVGQLSVALNGTMAFTEGEYLNVLSDGVKQRYHLGSYANIAPISPDGKSVVYNDDQDQLWVLDLQTSRRHCITDNSGSYALPQWSPDGSQILYSRLSGAMYVHSLMTSTSVLLGDGESPSWIDNSSVIYSHRIVDKGTVIGSELFRISSSGTDRRQLTQTADADECDPSYDAAAGAVIYADSKRSGLYSRSITEGEAAGKEQQLISADRSFLAPSRLSRTAVPSAPATAVAAYFEMPYVHQVWDTPDWYNGHSACGATSSIMVIAYFNIVPPWNVWCSASGSSPGHYSPYGNYVCESYSYRELSYTFTANDPNGKPSYGGYGFMWTGSYSPYSRTVDYYTNHGMTAQRFDSSASFFSTVIANVDSGYPFTLCNGLTTAGHIIAVNGYDVNNRTLIVNDPYGNKNTGVYPSLNGKGVKYDWVGYNNGYRNLNRIYWGVSVRYPKIARADSVVDDAHLGKGFFMSTNAPSSLIRWSDRKTNGYMNGHFWWTRTKMSDTCYAVWSPALTKDGLYEVSAFIPYSDATKARYVVNAADGAHTVVIDQKAVKNNWVPLGTFPFAQGTAGSVRLGDGSDTVKQAIIFDAVRWTYAGTSPLAAVLPSQLPGTFTLEQNFPNPFNPATVIEFTLPQRIAAVLTVSDLLGREVARLADGELNEGVHRFRFSAAEYGLASGVYLYSLRAGTAVRTKRMSIVK